MKTFNPQNVKCLSNNLFIEVYREEGLTIKTNDGQIKKLTNLNNKPEQYAKVHAVGEEIKTIKPGDFVLLKPTQSGVLLIEGVEYVFLPAYQVNAVIQEQDLHFFSNKNMKEEKPSSNFLDA